MDAEDEGVLLAETEDLLAALGPSAFGVVSPTVVRPITAESITHQQWGEDPPAPESSTRHGAEKRHVNSLEKIKHEAAALRKVEADLKMQLSLLQRINSSENYKKQILLTVWQDVANRQRQLRQTTEAENQKLKTMLFDILKAPERFAQYAASTGSLPLLKLPNYLHGPPKIRMCLEQRGAWLAQTCEALLDRLDPAYADMDAVFRANGLNERILEPRSFIKHKTVNNGDRDLGTRYIELFSINVAPIPAAQMSKLNWETLYKWHHKDSAYSHPCTDRSDDTFVVNYRGVSKATTENRSIVLTMAMRRYFMRDRFVFVWAAQSDGEKDLAGMYTTETGWFVISSVPGLHDSGSSLSALQSCMQIVPKSRNDGPMQPQIVNALLTCILAGFQEDISHIHQMVESAFLQKMRSESAPSRNHFDNADPEVQPLRRH
uniref:Uncharacterized protein n=1 Tax=Globisporangium ultimum (strain ATCC 200006 / CBS 805.95 / DAOM BR144) TaxID=431595 RepID=K3W9I8_GLOUD